MCLLLLRDEILKKTSEERTAFRWIDALEEVLYYVEIYII